MKKEKILKLLGNILTFLGLAYIVYLIFKLNVSFDFLLNPLFLLILLALALMLSSAVFINSIAWKKLIEMLSGSKLKTSEIVHVYAKSNTAKYLPGNIMHYASRNILGCKYNISHKDMLFSTILEIVLKIISSFILVIVLIQGRYVDIFEKLDDKLPLDSTTLLLIIGGLVILTAGFLLYKKRKDIKGRLHFAPILYAFASYALVFILDAAVFLIVSSLFLKDTKITGIVYTAGVYIIAWLIGYLTPGSPGGIGVRETVMILLLGDAFTLGIITQISVCLRLVTIVADVLAFAIDAVISRKMASAAGFAPAADAEKETDNSCDV